MARVLLSCVHYPVAAGRYVHWALRRLGHEVMTVGPAVGAYLPWANGTNLEPYEWKPDIPLSPTEYGKVVARPITDALEKCGTPDLILQMDAHFVMGGPAPCPNVLWAIDNHLSEYGAYESFDKIFIAHSWGHMSNLPQAEWLPCAYDPLQHFVKDETAARPFDVAIVGVAYEQRQQVISALRGAGIKVFGSTGRIYNEYNAIYNQAKIALVVSAQHDLAMRVFENMAQGCLVVADEAPDMDRVGFVHGVHYARYLNLTGCIHAVKKYLNPEFACEAQAMVRASREAVKPHTWESRVQHILTSAGL